MIRNLKIITSALAALLAMGAFASMAQAGSFDVGIGENGSTAIIGTNTTNHVFKIRGGETSCNNVRFEGTETGTPNSTKTGITDLTVTPIYTGCTTLGGFVGVTVRMNGCKYTFTGNEQAALTANVDIVGCTPNKTIEVEIPFTGCIITVQNQEQGQNTLKHVVATNNALPGNEMDFTAAATVTEQITYTEGAKCPEPGHFADGSYTGSVTVKAFVDNGTEKAIHNGHEYDKIKVGATQTEITAT